MSDNDRAAWHFTRACNVCGAEVTVAGGVEQPHTCRIDIDAQRGVSR